MCVTVSNVKTVQRTIFHWNPSTELDVFEARNGANFWTRCI